MHNLLEKTRYLGFRLCFPFGSSIWLESMLRASLQKVRGSVKRLDPHVVQAFFDSRNVTQHWHSFANSKG
jgi:hypothetical protein